MDDPRFALDEKRAKAIQHARGRAKFYAGRLLFASFASSEGPVI
jgi:hypothetical protein